MDDVLRVGEMFYASEEEMEETTQRSVCVESEADDVGVKTESTSTVSPLDICLQHVCWFLFVARKDLFLESVISI